MRRDPDAESGGARVTTWAASIVVRGRVVIVAAWLIGGVLAFVTMPHLATSGGAGLRGLVPRDSEAIETEIRDVEAFGFPLVSRTIVVQQDRDGLSVLAQTRAMLRAVALIRGEYPGLERIAGALPITNTLGLIAPEGAEGDTIITFLFFRPEVGLGEREHLANRFVAQHLDPRFDAPVGVTGAVPGRLEQARLVNERLPLVELVTVVLILAIVSIHFRAPGAAIVALTAAAVGYLVSVRLIAFALRSAGLGLPEELEPLVVVLLLGVVTDYSIFFLDHTREALRRGRTPREAAADAFVEIGPIIATAAVAVAIGTAALVVARLETFRALGPGMAVTVLIGGFVSMTFVPAAIALAGRHMFWPSLEHRQGTTETDERRMNRRRAMMRWLTERRRATIVSLAGVLVLVVLASAVTGVRLGFSIVGALPDDTGPRRAAMAASAGFADGVISPTTLLIESRDPGDLELGSLIDLQRAIERRPEVAGTIGPGDLDDLAALAGRLPRRAMTALPDAPARLILRAVVTPDRSTARILIVFDDPPLGGPAVRSLEGLRADAPALLRASGIDPRTVSLGFAGDTALAAETIDQTVADLVRIVVVVAILMTILLAAFLRALVAPAFLVAVSLLAFLAALGIAAIFALATGVRSLSFFVPFASAVLLISLGSDYNIFLVGRIWNRARDLTLRDAIVDAAPAASRAITVAGITLAGSFAVLALVPIRPMQQFAVAMAAGILLDTFVVRAVITPAMLAAVGPLSGWPGRVWTSESLGDAPSGRTADGRVRGSREG